MPIYEPDHIEYATTSGHVAIMCEDGTAIPAYWSHPILGGPFPSIAMLHDWWGISPLERRLANLLAASGYYVIMPDLFDGRTAATPDEARALVERLNERAESRVASTIATLENHIRTTPDTAAVGLGMGASLAYQAAITNPDLEAAVGFYGFPQRFLGQYAQAHAPILAVFGDRDPYVDTVVRTRLQQEFERADQPHRLLVLPDADRTFFDDDRDSGEAEAPASRAGSAAWNAALRFLLEHLPSARRQRKNPI
jgi:carboxymethylenebutenolidase